jgi:hypothetical protein
MAQPDAKVRSQSFLHDLKQPWQIVRIDEGMQIDCSDEHFSNAESPRHETRQRGSNATVKRILQWLKQCEAIVSTEEGMQIDRSDEQP